LLERQFEVVARQNYFACKINTLTLAGFTVKSAGKWSFCAPLAPLVLAVITGIPNNRSTIVALALQSDGNIVAVGNLTTPDFPTGRNSIAVARYLGQ
jgi:hypothetical protein